MSPTRASRRRRAALALGLSSALLLSGCSIFPNPAVVPGGDLSQAQHDQAPQPPAAGGSITVQPLFVQGAGGGVGSETITRKPTEDGSFRVDFSEDEVTGMGDSSRAASWNAAIVSTLLTSQPLSGRFVFEITGKIDGPSAGALKTVALLALSRSQKIPENATMTGTINATGAIGPVGGIPEKIKGAADAKIAKVLIPMGQRNTPDHTGALVDVVRAGAQLGVEVIEVGDVYAAYKELIGSELPTPTRNGQDPRLDNRSYDKVEAQVTTTFGRYESALQQLRALPAELVQLLGSSGVAAQAVTSYEQAHTLQRQGMIAGAYSKAQEAAALMETLYATGSVINPLLSEGIGGVGKIFAQATATKSLESTFFGFLDSLGTFQPQTVSDVEALVTAYAGAFDAYSLLNYANSELVAIQRNFESGGYDSVEDLVGQLTVALLYQKLASAQIANTQSIYELGRNNQGPAIGAGIQLPQVGDFFRRGAEANYAAFVSSGVVKELASANGLAPEVVIDYLARQDVNVGLATHQHAVLPAFEAYIGKGKPNSAYAAMGYGLNNYVRNQLLVEKYYNNAALDENFQVVGLNFEGALNNAIDLSRDQLAFEIADLRKREVQPVITVGTYEAARGAASATAEDKFAQLGRYSDGFVTARLLDYIGGWH